MYWSVTNAKKQFTSLIAAAQEAPQVLTKHGKPTAVMISVDTYQALSNPHNFKDFLLSAPKVDWEFERINGFVEDRLS